MKKVKSEEYFFPIIKKSFMIFLIILMVLAYFIDAPLQPPANPAVVPNPSKSAWFLLWMQELVSYSGYMIYFVIFLFLYMLYLPKIRKGFIPENAKWFQKGCTFEIVTFLIILMLINIFTIIAYYFRGPYWQLIGF
ncbi:conserved hypothetical protein [Deferribacter desulfuricans SSM1]|uniref:Uncharacterized protein n=1 Tax=Deferribacter desulfuricans (strain DSM 14783 / JCM 11476 / NBRC 101012 / SSM1) TaxID=639282 RepID=D3PC33_DEFDS|nr:hypothetical protein [Deferribacter desulfuricans]BAI80156.1 conserved hypothetical protein [Deferribacter desulfuricans SSM1]